MNHLDYTFYFWGDLISILGIIIGTSISVWLYLLSKRLSTQNKYNHEVKITTQLNKLKFYQSVILADVKKYRPFRTDTINKTYYKQGAELYTIIPEYGVQLILRTSDEKIPVGLVPFEWIEYIREYDSEDIKPIIVCKFKGTKWYDNFKSPFKEIEYMKENLEYNQNSDPAFMKFTNLK